MKEGPLTEALLREFLLGNVNDEERQRIESLFLTDQLARERVLAAEEGLIDDYLDGSLTNIEREQFLKRYDATPAQQQKLKLARSIKAWATTEGDVSHAKPATVSVSSGWRERFGLRSAFVVPIAATVVIAIVASLVWLNSRNEERQRRVTMQEELVKLNDPLHGVPPQVALELKPLSYRSGEPESEIVIGPDVQVAELRFIWLRPEVRHPRYRAVVRRVGTKESVATQDLPAEADGKTIRLKLPVHLLTRGNYTVELGGLNADGTLGPTEEYRFTVRR